MNPESLPTTQLAIRARGEASEGTLGQTPFPALLQALFLAGRTGTLVLTQRNLEKRIALEEGVPVACESNLAHEGTARFLTDKGRLTPAQCQSALAEAALAHERVEDTLLRLGMVAPFDLFKSLQQNLAFKILDCFCAAWAGASYRVLPEPPAVAQPLRVNLSRLIFTGVCSFSPFHLVDLGAGPLRGQRLALAPAPPHELRSLKLNPTDARVLRVLKRGATLEALVAETRLSAEDALRRVYALYVLGHLEREEILAQTPPPAPAARPSVTPPSTVGSTPRHLRAAEVEKKRNEVVAAYLRYRTQDPFELFGLPVGANHVAMRDAYLSYCERFAPWAFTHPELAPLAEKARDLFLFGSRAFAQLVDADQRALILKRRAAAGARRTAAPDFAIHTDLLDGRLQHEEGLRRLARGETVRAAEYLEFACDCEPRNALFRAHLAGARLSASPLSPSAARADIDEALRLDPECAEAVLVLGDLHRAAGELTQAEEAYRRASKLAPGDRRPVEALKALLQRPQK